LIAGNPNGWLVARDAAMVAYLVAYHYYRDHPDPFLSGFYPSLWVYGAAAMIDIDADWQVLLGTLAFYQRYLDPETGHVLAELSAYENDGIVPFASAMYPGGTRNALITGGILHTEQTESPAVVGALETMLRSEFFIPDRVTEPPPPTYGMQ